MNERATKGRELLKQLMKEMLEDTDGKATPRDVAIAAMREFDKEELAMAMSSIAELAMEDLAEGKQIPDALGRIIERAIAQDRSKH